MNVPLPSPADLELAEVVRAACLRAALDAFEAASISGLCCTGAWECAVGAVRTLDLEELLRARHSVETGSRDSVRRASR